MQRNKIKTSKIYKNLSIHIEYVLNSKIAKYNNIENKRRIHTDVIHCELHCRFLYSSVYRPLCEYIGDNTVAIKYKIGNVITFLSMKC